MGQFPSLQQLDDSGGGGVVPTFLQQFLSEKMGCYDANPNDITYEKFVQLLTEINSFSENCLDIDGNQLIFAIKKGTDSTILWKTTIQIACVKFNKQQQKISSYRLLKLNEFLTICKTIKSQTTAVVQSERNQATSNTKLLEKSKECCICLERQQQVILPCAHSYCLPCIEQWNEIHDTCPICREKLESLEDTWELPGIPTVNEINKEIQTSLMDLMESKSSNN